MEDGQQILEGIGQIKDTLCKADLPALDPAHIQDFIDQSQKMLAGDGDLAKGVQDAFLIVYMHAGDSGHTKDGVHRCADILLSERW